MRSPLVLHIQKVGGISGSEAHLLSLLPRLRERGWNIRFLMLHEHEPGAWEFARELEAGGVPLDDLPIRADVDPLAFVRLLGYVLRTRPTILHTHLIHADAYGQMAGLLAGVPVRLSTKHGFNEFREGKLFALGDRLIVAAADTQISISRGLAQYLVETEGFSEGTFEIVHYGIDASPEPPTPLPEGPPRFLCIGRLIPIKGHIVLLRAFRAALESRPDLKLDIAGRGVLDAGLRDFAAELGVGDSVRFLGHVSPVARAIEESTAIVVPSIGEGFGMVALEAMERARPVVASAIGGLTDIVREGETGYLVPVAEAEPLTDAMLRLANDPAAAAAMGAAARERALTRFPQVRCTDRTDRLYRDLLAARLDSSVSIPPTASTTSTKSHAMR
jgi:glycosyltransferase involved in cell wall biosynthesis